MKKKFKDFKELLAKKKEPLITTSLLVFVLLGYQNCQEASDYYKLESGVTPANIKTAGDYPNESTGTGDSSGNNETSPGNTNDDEDASLCEDNTSTNLICNPLNNNQDNGETIIDTPSVPKRRLGLIGHIYEGKSQWNNIETYFIEGYRHPEEVYFSNFNIPKRSFNSGFGQANQFLKDSKGEKLIEWFAIKVTGHIALPENEESGFYHITSTSDDGIQILVNGKKIINNPNTHAVTIDCASELIYLEKSKELPFELNYFQGPRYHIALQVLIKKVDNPEAFKKSSLCRKEASNHTGLVKEGYKIITPPWFTLPNGH